MWTPGYWAYDQEGGYYWVPGAWVPAPYGGALWTPPYWGWNNGQYGFHDGYWGQTVGYYGGVNYGFGFGGVGFAGGEWRGGSFAYNTAVTQVKRECHSCDLRERDDRARRNRREPQSRFLQRRQRRNPARAYSAGTGSRKAGAHGANLVPDAARHFRQGRQDFVCQGQWRAPEDCGG